MITYPVFSDKQAALDTALSTAQLTGTERYVVCHAGQYYVRLRHKQGPLANWFAHVLPDGTVIEGF